MIPYAKHSFNLKEINAVLKQLNNGSIARGKIIQDFEQQLDLYLNSYTVTCSSGSSALEIALRSAGIKPGDEVIVPNISWIATASAVNLVGATPVFCDIEKDYPNISLSHLKILITNKTKAVIPVHFGGVCVDLQALSKICKPNKILIIEDACHAFGGKYKDGKMIGSSNYSYCACFSFHPAKNITTGEGGLISTNKIKIKKKISIIRSGGIVRKKADGIQKAYYDCEQIGSNYHMTSLSAAIGIEQLKKIDKFVNSRKKLWKRYQKNLNINKNIYLYQHNENSAFNLCLIKVYKGRDKLLIKLNDNGVGAYFHYPQLRAMSVYKKSIKSYKEDAKNYINSLNYARSSLTLPLYPDMTIKQVDQISKIILSYMTIT